MSDREVWLSIDEYSVYRGLSVSTIRRYIKAGRVKFKTDKGKYFIWADGKKYERENPQKEILELKLKISKLELELRKAQEENNEYKMLVELYERGQRLKPHIMDDIPQVPNL